MARAEGAGELLAVGKEMTKGKFIKAAKGLKDTVIEIGKGGGLAVLTSILQPFAAILEIFSPILEVISGLFEVLVGEILVALMPLLQPFIDFLIMLIPAFRFVGQAIGGFLKWLIGEGGLLAVFKFLGDVLFNIFVKPILFIVDLIAKAWEGLFGKDGIFMSIFKFFGDLISNAWNFIFGEDGFIVNVFRFFGDMLKGIANIFIGIANFLIDAVNFIADLAIFGLFIPDIPHLALLARGGILTSPTMVGRNTVAGEAGDEAVVPLDKFWAKIDEQTAAIEEGNEIRQEQLIFQKRTTRQGKRRFG